MLLVRQVTKAYDGQEAYEEIVKSGGPDAFDVILMDLHMPRMVRCLSLQPRYRRCLCFGNPAQCEALIYYHSFLDGCSDYVRSSLYASLWRNCGSHAKQKPKGTL